VVGGFVFFGHVAGAVILRGFERSDSAGRRSATACCGSVCVTHRSSFPSGLYFCLWHSVRGFEPLRREIRSFTARFIAAVHRCQCRPVDDRGWGRFVWNGTSAAGVRGPRGEFQALFIGLSAIAGSPPGPPHLLLHGLPQTGFVIPTNPPRNPTISSERMVTS